MNILIVIPARGGSKGIPRKNLRNLNGKPLISYAIKTALSSKYKPEIYVSSDDDEILHIAGKYGAKLYKRDKSIALIPTLLPLPVVPAISKCGSFLRSVTKAFPTISLPKAMVKGEEDF